MDDITRMFPCMVSTWASAESRGNVGDTRLPFIVAGRKSSSCSIRPMLISPLSRVLSDIWYPADRINWWNRLSGAKARWPESAPAPEVKAFSQVKDLFSLVKKEP